MKKSFIIILFLFTTNNYAQTDLFDNVKSWFKTDKENIIGTWVIDSLNNYSFGTEDKIRRKDINLKSDLGFVFVGSTKNPITYKFTKYNELFIHNFKYKDNINIDKLITENMITSSSESHTFHIRNHILFLSNGEKYNIEKLDYKNLIIKIRKINFEDFSHTTKVYYTYFFTRVIK